MKKILTWELHNDNNKGKFKCKVKEKSNRTHLVSGKTADGKAFEYNCFIADSVEGQLVWVDYIDSKFNKKLRIVLKTDKGLNQLDLPFDTKYLSSVIGAFLTLDKKMTSEFLSITHAIMLKDKDGKPFLKLDGTPTSKRYLFIKGASGNIKPFFGLDNPKPENIKWTKNAKGEWDDSKEIIFWISKIVDIQELLLKKNLAIPLSFGSLTVTNVENDFYTIVTPELREKAEILYKTHRSEYSYINSSSSSNSSSNFFDEASFMDENTKPLEDNNTSNSLNTPFGDEDDLPY